MLPLVLAATLVFISDVQLNSLDAYPDSVACHLSSLVGDGPVYDCGDLVENGPPLEELEYARYRELFPHSVPVPGNHDHYDGLADWVWPTLVDHWVEGVHIIGFDSNHWADPVMCAQLRALATDDAFTVLFMHHPIYSCNSRVGGVASIIRLRLLPVIEECDIDLIIAGHGHAYEHLKMDGRDYLVIGGGGAHLDTVEPEPGLVCAASVHHWLEVEVNGAGLVCTARGLDGTVLDTFALERTVPTRQQSWGNLRSMFR